MALGAGVWARGAVVSERGIAHARDHARKGWSLTLNSLELVSSDVDATLLSRFWLRRPPPIGGFLEKVERTVAYQRREANEAELSMAAHSHSFPRLLLDFSVLVWPFQRGN